MKFEVRLFHLGSKACDGSTISREVVNDYLNSDRYAKIIANRTSYGGITHIDRNISIKSIGPDDGPLNSGNYAFYITEIYIKGDDVYAIAETLNPDDFSGRQRDVINSVIGYLKAGSKLGISVVVSGEWSVREECKRIDNILGFDFTNNPSFKDAEVVKVFSKLNSNELVIKGFSEVRLLDDTVDINEEVPLVLLEDEEFLNDLNANVVNTKNELRALCNKHLKTKYYTYDVNLIDRILISRKPIFSQSYLLLKGYNKYYNSHRALVKANPRKFLWMLMSDFASILHNGLNKISSNISPAAVLGLKGYSDELESALNEFTNTHFYNMRMMDRTGFLVKNHWLNEINSTRRLYNSVIKYVTNNELSLGDEDRIILI